MYLNLYSDFTKLSKDFNIDVSGALRNIIDLGTYTNKILNFDSRTCWSMANLVEQLVNLFINNQFEIVITYINLFFTAEEESK